MLLRRRVAPWETSVLKLVQNVLRSECAKKEKDSLLLMSLLHRIVAEPLVRMFTLDETQI